VQDRRLPRLDLRLYGRALARGRAMIAYASAMLPGAGTDCAAPVRLSLARDLTLALTGCDAVICQVRAGGMAGRAGDEAMALAAGVPADEGLGPAGLANYLRSRPLLDRIGEAWAVSCPEAVLFQLSSPLGLAVARLARHGGQVVGLCELPATTSAAVRAVAEPELGALRHAHFGSNHQSWLYEFRDLEGRDCTEEVIELAAAADILPADVAVIRAEKAVPVGYLRLHYERSAVLAEQRSRQRTRGEEVMAWAEALDAAYLAEPRPDNATIADLLARRRMDWHDKAVVPAMAAWAGCSAAELVVNVTGVAEDIAVELPCRIGGGAVTPLRQPPLPAGPSKLHHRLADYERGALALSDQPRDDEIAEVLLRHPLVPDHATAARLGRNILARRDAGR